MNNQNETHNMEVKLQVAFFREDDFIIAYSPELDLSAYGKSESEAQKAFDETFRIFVEETLEKGTLLNELLKLGWQLKNTEFRPPVLSKKGLKLRLNSLPSLRNTKEPRIIKTKTREVSIPA